MIDTDEIKRFHLTARFNNMEVIEQDGKYIAKERIPVPEEDLTLIAEEFRDKKLPEWVKFEGFDPGSGGGLSVGDNATGLV